MLYELALSGYAPVGFVSVSRARARNVDERPLYVLRFSVSGQPSRLHADLAFSFTVKATLHRVVFPSTPAPATDSASPGAGFAGRRSIAFFSQPKHDVVFNPISKDGTITVTPGALTSKEFFIERMKAAAY